MLALWVTIIAEIFQNLLFLTTLCIVIAYLFLPINFSIKAKLTNTSYKDY